MGAGDARPVERKCDMNPIAEIKTGVAIIREWLGEGGIAVPRDVAEDRAAICVGCPENVQPRWWEGAKTTLAEVMLKHLEEKNKASLNVLVESKLGICRVCGCCNPLAVWVPPEHLKKHTSPETVAKFPDFCWKKHL